MNWAGAIRSYDYSGVGLKDLRRVYAAWREDGRPAQDYQYFSRP
jgi:hypothetical protein